MDGQEVPRASKSKEKVEPEIEIHIEGKIKLHEIHDQYDKICMVSDIHTHTRTHTWLCVKHVYIEKKD